MRICAVTLRGAALATTFVLIVAPIAPHAQRAREAEREQAQEQERTLQTPTMRLSLFEGLGEAQACMDEEDFECARERLDRLASMRGLTPYEIAQVH